MSRKAFLVKVELDIQAVTCPGVWLCSNGKVALQIYMLDSCVQTNSYKPNFPINCNETFVFYKTFYSKHQLNELEKELHDQWLYIELVQWKSCDMGTVLATFKTNLDELLYPTTYRGSIAGVDLDLLMEPTKSFPGKISPKVEVSTKTTIEETLCVCTKPTSSTVIINPKVLTSSPEKPRRNVCRRVCHSIGFSKKRRPYKTPKARPIFCYRRAEDDLILRKPTELNNNYCRCRLSKSLERKNLHSLKRRKPCKESKETDCPCTVRLCSCGSGHRENLCPVCAKYKGYFSTSDIQNKDKTDEKAESQPRTNLFDRNCCRHSKTNNRCPCCRPMAFAEDKSNTTAGDTNFSDSELDRRKVCLCDTEKKPSLAEKLHAKLTKTLSSIPRTLEWPCYEYEVECDCCDCPRPSRAELYRDLQKFYGDLYEKASRSKNTCVPDCPGFK